MPQPMNPAFPLTQNQTVMLAQDDGLVLLRRRILPTDTVNQARMLLDELERFRIILEMSTNRIVAR